MSSPGRRGRPACLDDASFPEVSIPLRRWVRNETLAGRLPPEQSRQSLVRKTTVAYAIAELLDHLNGRRRGLVETGIGPADCTLDNFVVRVANSPDAAIEGVDVISHPGVGVSIVSPSLLGDEFLSGESDVPTAAGGENDGQELGQFLEVEIRSDSVADPLGDDAAEDSSQEASGEDSSICHLFGALLYELYSETPPFVDLNGAAPPRGGNDDGSQDGNEPRRKETVADSLSIDVEGGDLGLRDASRPPDSQVMGDDSTGHDSGGRPPKYASLTSMGYPASISLLVNDLLECGWGEDFRSDDTIPSLEAASEDLHLMLQDPCRFLFNRIPDGDGAAALDMKQNKLYGRDKERSLFSDMFCRVSMTGETEALFIAGFSGSGKTKLVESLVDYVDSAGAYIIQQKFGQISQERAMAAVISAFNDLCTVISRKRTVEELHAIVGDLTALFGTQLSTLVGVLPNVALLSPELNVVAGGGGQSTEINLNRVGFILQLFVRVMSSKEHPILLFLDDLQWVDNASFDVIAEILTVVKGSSCVAFIGSYRCNEVSKEHAIFRFMAGLEACNIDVSRIDLDGMELEDVNQMISDALGTVPRICRPLSRIVLRRTEGNPLFVLECLRSLADKDLLHYGFRERRWVWDVDEIAAEAIADNVCELLSTKMISLPESSQMALRVASCLGSTITLQTAETLASASPNFSTLSGELEKAVDEGFMTTDDLGSIYTFAHDKVREAAYSLVGNKSEFHHEIGMLLYYATPAPRLDSMIFVIVDQINYGNDRDPSLRQNIVELNHRAATKAMRNSDFAGAHYYSNAAVQLLPQDHWESNYDLSRSIFLVIGNAACTEGHDEEAMSALETILNHGRSLEDKLDAYYLKITLLHSRQEWKLAHDICVEVLTQLGETLPTAVTPENLVAASDKIRSELRDVAEEDWMSMKEMDRPLHCSLMKFYCLASFISYFIRSPLVNWYTCKLVELSLEHGVCKFSGLGLMSFAFTLRNKPTLDIEGGYRLGKMAFKLMERFDATDLSPWMYLMFYGYIGVHNEPFQACADMAKRGLETGLSIGDPQMALMNGLHYVQKSLLSGSNLVILKHECDYQMHLTDALSLPMSKMFLSAMQGTVATLIAKDVQSSDRPEENGVAAAKEHLPTHVLALFHQAVTSFWLGHYDRCMHQAEKYLKLEKLDVSGGNPKVIMITFYKGISSFHSRQKWMSDSELGKASMETIKLLDEMAAKSSWNYSNKSHLLTAHLESAMDKNEEARDSFVAAINSAKASKFIHEQGLACELAAMHCLKCSDCIGAMDLLEQARECYGKWGSQMKVDCITRLIVETAKKLESGTAIEP